MKKFVRAITMFLALLLSTSVAIAKVESNMEGKGSVVEAVKAFNKAVVKSGGMVNGNAVTEFSSAGDFGRYQATISVESEKGKVSIFMVVVSKKPNVFRIVGGIEIGEEMEIATKIENEMKKMGYTDTTKYEEKK
jgi:hypothetical protein